MNSSNPSNSINFIRFIAMSLLVLAITSCSGDKMEPTAKTTLPSIKDIPAGAWQKLSEIKIYFGHQSVGFNIIDGVKDVMKENSRIKLNIVETTNPADFDSHIFAHSPIGKNMDPTSKCVDFSEKMTQGLGNKLDIAFFKFCYIDITSTTDVNKVFREYKDALSLTKKNSPKVTIIHVTIPLRVIQASGLRTLLKKIIGRPLGGYDDNLKREQFNALLRKEYTGKEPIFDLALIESTYPDGSRLAFTQNGKTGYALVPEYTNDGGHLNEMGRKLVAEQLLIFLSKI